MPRAEKGTPRYISNKIKSKGLQKLKWFCQMCQKQCRDANGFKCHLTSESHQRQMLLFAENSKAYLNEFSKEFDRNFMQILRYNYGTRRVRANEVYQEYIRDKGHVHMNSTVWHTLTGYIHHLEKTGRCRVDEDDRGWWYVQYIDQEEEVRKKKLLEKAKHEKDDEERASEMLQRRIEVTQQRISGEEDDQSTAPREFQRAEGEGVVKFGWLKKKKTG